MEHKKVKIIIDLELSKEAIDELTIHEIKKLFNHKIDSEKFKIINIYITSQKQIEEWEQYLALD